MECGANTDMTHFPPDIAAIATKEGAPPLPPLSLDILRWLEHRRSMTIEGFEARTDAHRSTLKLRLRELIAAGLVRRHGKGKATWYTL
jgi:DNA-binding transcriptional ArsR family regulator